MMIAAVVLVGIWQAPQSPPCSDDRAECNPWEREWQSDPVVNERLGSGPHTLVISDGEAITRMNYRSGAQCQRARDEVRRQVAPPPNTRSRIYGPPRVTAFCVPR
jgi:hypothetical protein